jgi:oxygen-dependent protoporphyrinogen oxidase
MKVAVLGGGVTGLTAAWKLAQAGHSVRVLDAGDRPGGVVRTDQSGGWLTEGGPISFQESSPEIAGVVAGLGLTGERVEANPAAANRYVARKGRLVAVPAPTSLAGFLTTPLLSFRSKLAVGSEASRSPVNRATDISVAELVRDHFGSEILETFVQPLIGGIYAGDAERLSAKHAFPKIWEAERTVGSFVRAAADGSKRRSESGLPTATPLISFRGGLQALTAALAGRLPKGALTPRAEVGEIAQGKASRWSVRWKQAEGPGSEEFDWVVAALPAWSLAALAVGPAGARPLSGLSAIEYPPVASISLGFRREQVSHPLDGFGALVPAAEGRTMLGVVFASSLFPGRAPAGHVALTAFAGGALRPEVARLGAAELASRVCEDLRVLLGAEGRPVMSRHTLWPRAIPQYNLGHGAHVEAMARCEKANPGLLIGGNVRDGISLPDCIKSGLSLASRVS